MSDRVKKTIEGFGDEWLRFDQSHLSNHEFSVIYDSYFSVLPKGCIDSSSLVADIGAGSGRFALINAPKCNKIVAFEPSNAATLCQEKLKQFPNATVISSTIDEIPIHFHSNFDLVYCLGVLHHTASIRSSLEKISKLVKPGGYILLYVYYNFDNKSLVFRAIWFVSNLIRLFVSRLPSKIKYIIADAFAVLIYLPLAKISASLEAFGFDVSSIPLSTYRKYSFQTMRTDSLDRFGTRIEHRISKMQLHNELSRIGFTNIRFSNNVPYWTVCALKE